MRSVTLKSAMTPSFMGRMATILPGVRPSISLASFPTASTSPVVLLMATMDGSLTTMPLPLANTSVLAVPRSMARSDEKRLKSERKFIGQSLIRGEPGRTVQASHLKLPHGQQRSKVLFNFLVCFQNGRELVEKGRIIFRVEPVWFTTSDHAIPSIAA